MMSGQRHFFGLSTVAAISLGAMAHAADQPAASSGQLEEIVVTSQKRSEALDKVPISVTAIDQAMRGPTCAGAQPSGE
jgi:outer membrane receptor protein involved in Fe transport